jgi:hypothetical protein
MTKIGSKTSKKCQNEGPRLYGKMSDLGPPGWTILGPHFGHFGTPGPDFGHLGPPRMTFWDPISDNLDPPYVTIWTPRDDNYDTHYMTIMTPTT